MFVERNHQVLDGVQQGSGAVGFVDNSLDDVPAFVDYQVIVLLGGLVD